MSKQVDERIVSMEFDNRNFEKNVSTTMSTLDKLKAKLKFGDAGKSFEGISKAAKNVNFSGLTSGIQTVQTQFSAMEVMGVTALANITNSAVNTGKRMVSALTIDPISTGLSEYETQINAIQTILSNTRSKGTTIDQVNEALDELNTYADQTIYNFTEMTRNIGTFTAAGIDLDKSVSAIKGIANLAAVSGSSSYQASTAMYQLSQALATGRVALQDWNSVVNAGMGGQLFQDALKRTAEHLGYNVDQMIEKYGSFRASLTEGQWLTSEVLTETLSQISGAYTEADLISQGYTAEQAKEIRALADDAVIAATRVKTFTQLWDVMKESAQSGWTQTWEIIIGDYEQASELLSGISDFFTGENGIITKMSNTRNALLEGALGGNPFSDLAKKIESVTGVTEEMTKATTKYGEVVDRVIGGEFGNGQSRFDALTKAGYDWAYVQNLVNERLGDSTRHATNFKESTDELNKSQATTVEQLIAMSDAQLKNLGFTQDEIDAFNQLEEQSRLTGIPIKSLLENMDQLNGRTLLINSFKNAAQGLVAVFSSVGKAWRDIFPAMQSDQLYNIIASLHRFSTYLVVSDETADKLRRTLRGVFSILDIVTTILGGGFKVAFKAASAVLSAFDMDILDVTASLGDAVYNFRNFLLENELVTKGFEKFGEGVVYVVKAAKRLIDAFMALPQVQNAIERFKDGLTSFKEIGQNMIEGLIEGLQNGTLNVVNMLVNLGKQLLEAIKGVLGIHSPSTEMFAIGRNVILGLVNGIKAGLSMIWNSAKEIGLTILDALGDVDWGTIAAVAISAGLLITLSKIADAITTLASPLEGVGDVLESASYALDQFGGVLKSMSISIKANAIKSLAVSLLMLVGAVVLMSQINPANLWSAIGALTALAGVMTLFSMGIGKFGPKDTKAFVGFAVAMAGISGALLIMTVALKRLEKTDPDKFPVIIQGFTTIVLALVGVVAAYGLLVTGPNAANVEKAGSMFLKLSISMLIMTQVIRAMSGMSASDVAKGAAAITVFVGVFTALALITKLAPGVSALGSTLLKMSAAMLLLIVVIKLISGLSPGEMAKGIAAIALFVGVFALLALITRLGGANMAKLGTTLLAMSASMLILALVVKLMGGVSIGEILKGTAALVAFTGVIALLTLITKLADKEMPKLGGTLLAMSVSIGILAAIAVLLSLVDIGGLAKGIVAVGLLSSFMALMLYATRGVQDVKGNLIVMAVCIGLLAAAVAGLSFIDTGKLAGATAAMSLLMASFALMAKASGTMKASMSSIITMTMVVGLLAGIIALLATTNADLALESAASMSVLLLSMSAAMAILNTVNGVSAGALVGIGVMTSVVAALGGILYLLRDLPVESSLATTASLSTLLLAMSAACLILIPVGAAGSAALVGIGILAALVVALSALLVAIGALATYVPQVETFLDKGIPILEKIGYALGSFFGNIVGGFSAGVTSGLPEIGTNISSFITNLSPGLTALQGVDSSAISGMGTIAAVIGMIGASSFIDSILSLLTIGGSTMDVFGNNLRQFSDIMVEFSNSISGNIDPEAITAVATAGAALAEMQVLLGASDIISFFTGQSNLETFGEQIKKFGKAMVGFSATVSAEGAINAEAITAAKNAAMIMVELQKAIEPTGGWLQSIMGTKDLGVFGDQLVDFGKAIVRFSNTVSKDGAINVAAIEAAKNAGLLMAELQKAVVPVGGIVQAFTGTQDLATFGIQLVAFGSAIVNFSNTLTQNGGVDTEAVTSAQQAGLLMAELQTAITPFGGVLEFFTGSTKMGEFGEQIKKFGQAIVDFSNTVVNGGGISVAAVNSAKYAGLTMAALQEALPEDHWFDGKVTLDDFGSDLKAFGKGIKGFSDNVQGIDSASIDTALSAANRLVTLTNGIVDLDSSGIESFKKVKDLGSSLSSYASSVAELNYETINSSISSINNIVNLIRGMVGLDSSGISSFSEALRNLGSTSISSFLEPFNSSTSRIQNVGSTLVNNIVTGINLKKESIKSKALELMTLAINTMDAKKTEFKTTSTTLMTNFINGITEKKTQVISSFTTALTEALTAIRGQYTEFYNAGNYLVEGFAAGITENTFKAEAKAAAMARAARRAAEEELDEHSPSKVFYGIGAFAGQGFVNALGDYAGKAYDASANMASKARTGLSAAIGKLSDVVNSDMDVNPTIRPVVDLTNVRNGMSTINDLMSMTQSPILATTAGQIGYTLNRTRQNGPNDDVISAIDRLRGELGNVGGTSYTVNGITYDDGSNVSEAVRSLVRAARIDRRV